MLYNNAARRLLDAWLDRIIMQETLLTVNKTPENLV
jgi:hypothetical protein